MNCLSPEIDDGVAALVMTVTKLLGSIIVLVVKAISSRGQPLPQKKFIGFGVSLSASSPHVSAPQTPRRKYFFFLKISATINITGLCLLLSGKNTCSMAKQPVTLATFNS